MSEPPKEIGTVGARLTGLGLAGLLAVSCSSSTVPAGPGVALANVTPTAGEPTGRIAGSSRGAQAQVAAVVNAFRVREGKRPFTRHAGLDALAQAHAEAMMRRDRMSHDGFERRCATGRSRHGLEWMAENVMWDSAPRGPDLAAQIVQRWIGSRGHRKNLLMKNEHIGVGVARGADGSVWAVQVSARRARPGGWDHAGAQSLPEREFFGRWPGDAMF